MQSLTPNPDILNKTDEEIMEIAYALRTAYALKRTLRYNTVRDFEVHSESVAEHVFALLYLSEYFLYHEDTGGILDKETVNRILLFHDFGEIVDGDIPYHLKTKEDEDREREAAETIFASLPHPLDTHIKEWHEYEERSTPESLFANALDRIEPIFETLDPVGVVSIKRGKYTYESHIRRKFPATEPFPVMRKFVEVITRDMVSRDVFWSE